MLGQYAVHSELSFSDLVGMKQRWFQVGCGSSDPLDKNILCLFGKKSVPAAKTTVHFVIMEMKLRFAVENKGHFIKTPPCAALQRVGLPLLSPCGTALPAQGASSPFLPSGQCPVFPEVQSVRSSSPQSLRFLESQLEKFFQHILELKHF